MQFKWTKIEIEVSTSFGVPCMKSSYAVGQVFLGTPVQWAWNPIRDYLGDSSYMHNIVSKFLSTKKLQIGP